MSSAYNGRVEITSGNAIVSGELSIPDHSRSVVVIPRTNDKSYFDSCLGKVADHLNDANYGTLMIYLSKDGKEENCFNKGTLKSLSVQLIDVLLWLEALKGMRGYRIGLLSTTACAAATLMAAADLPKLAAVISLGGRPDLISEVLHEVHTPTLFIAESDDVESVSYTKKAYSLMRCEKKLDIVTGESNKIKKICMASLKWFELYMQPVKLFEN